MTLTNKNHINIFDLLHETRLLLVVLGGQERDTLSRIAMRHINDHNCVSLFTVDEMSDAELRTFDANITKEYFSVVSFKKTNLSATLWENVPFNGFRTRKVA